MKNAYNYTGADRLIPLIRVIHREIRDRSEAVRNINTQLHQLGKAGTRRSTRAHELEAFGLQADRSNHKREIRVAKKELARMGCLLDEENPFRVLIPGTNGEIQSGYSWRVGENRVRAFAPDGPNQAA